jgi:hypothetical protein
MYVILNYWMCRILFITRLVGLFWPLHGRRQEEASAKQLQSSATLPQPDQNAPQVIARRRNNSRFQPSAGAMRIHFGLDCQGCGTLQPAPSAAQQPNRPLPPPGVLSPPLT